MQVGEGAATPIGFTTQLGKQWEVWMAYRELVCNAKDERGSACHVTRAPAPAPGTTKIIVRGEAFAAVFDRSYLYLLEDEPSFTVGETEVRARPGADFFYRGVRVHQFSSPGLYTYNAKAKIELTEDRTVKNQWEIYLAIMTAIMRSGDARFIRDCVLADESTIEGGLDYHGWGVAPGATFLSVVGDCVGDRATKVNASALKVWKSATKQVFTPREILLTKVQLVSLNRALDFCGRIGFTIRDAYPIKIVESLGEGCLGLAQDQTIFIAERVFHLGGTKQLASTLIEEYLHLRHGWKDLTRELQSFLFEKLVSIGEELTGEPL
jgi:hypothetical protein